MVGYFKQNKNGELCCYAASFIGDVQLIAGALGSIIN
ncbi:MAG: hypothetical protein ACI9CO_002091 [Candidatus Azotimanducaceae bacterium]|jgi:hypothetical protein